MEETINGSSDIEEAGQVNISDPMSECLVPVVAGEAGPSAECVPNSLMSPMKTIETIETIVSTNKVAVYATIESPKVGMVFKTWQEVESYYKEYAEQQGFGVTRSQGWASKKTKERRGTTWRCECWGHLDTRARRAANKRAKSMDVSGIGIVDGVIGEDELSRCKRTSKKCECGAQIYASMNQEGLWVLRKVVLDHVHKVSPTKSKLVKEYRMKKLTTHVRRNLIQYYDEGVPVTQIHGCLGLDKSEEIVLTVKDLQHEIYKERKARLNLAGGDCAAMMEYFEKMQADNSNFYHTHRLDEDGRMKDVMWVDARSMAAFEYFGDVVCMDATYLTNEYELPFVNIVGVNHHGQSILLGAVLVSHEDTDTYCWFIRQWLACMSNNAPNAILTDQAAAIRKPLSLEMPTARHRWCIWHIMRKLPEKLGKCDGYADFKSPLKKVIYESFSKEEFESRWMSLISEHKLEENDWLSDLYEERHMWVPAFMKEHFWAGMKTTQRVESINSFFDGYVNRNTMLHEFPIKYNKAMTKRVKDENDADARCSKYERRLVSGFKLEKMFQKIYTDKISGNSKGVCSYDACISSRRAHSARQCCPVCVGGSDQNLVFDIPKRYILDRWRKDIVRRHTRVKVSYYDPSDTVEVKRFNKMMTKFESICDAASSVDDPTVELVMERLPKLSNEVIEARTAFQNKKNPACLPKNSIRPSEIGSNTALAEVTPQSVTKPTAIEKISTLDTIIDPKSRKKPHGRPKSTRYKSLAESGYKKNQFDTNGPDLAPKKHPLKRKLHVCEEEQVDEELQNVQAKQVKRKRNVKAKKKDAKNANIQDCNNIGAAIPDEDDLLLRNFVGWSSPSNAF